LTTAELELPVSEAAEIAIVAVDAPALPTHAPPIPSQRSSDCVRLAQNAAK
jgi:hypothetical protein